MDPAFATVVSWGDRCPAGTGTCSPQAFHSLGLSAYPLFLHPPPFFLHIYTNPSAVLVFSESPVPYQVLLPLTIPGQL